MASMKPIKLYGAGGPNPLKVAMILKQLGIAYETVNVGFDSVKKPEYTALNPNGRIPTIEDPNTGITLWESGAIIEYLVQNYDKDNKFSFPGGSAEDWHTKQWLYFQVSGQGPYYGQMTWFSKFHTEKLPSAVERYAKEINRVTMVLDNHLAQQKEKYPGGDGPWLVGGKMSYADVAFVPWQRVPILLSHEALDAPEKYPNAKTWFDKMMALDSVKDALAASNH